MMKGNWAQSPATSNVIAPRGFGYYDAFAHDPFSVSTHMSIGPATPIVGTTVVNSILTQKPGNLEITAGYPRGLQNGAVLLVVMPSTSKVQAATYSCSTTVPTDVCDWRMYASDQLSADPPDNCIPTRCSMRIRNWTQQVGVGGIVRVLRMTTGVALSTNGLGGVTNNAELADFMESIRVHARTRTYGGEELVDSHQKNCTIVDQSKSTWFTDFGVEYNNSNLPWARALGWPDDIASNDSNTNTWTAQLHDPSYTPIAILFEPFVAAVSGGSVGNTYEVNVRSQFLGHYSAGTMLANMAIDPPTDPGTLVKHRDKEEAKGSLLDKIGDALRDGASWAWNHRSDIGTAAGYLWKYGRNIPKIP